MSNSIANTITSGTVSIEDGVKAKEEFAPARKAKVELSFSVPEGQDGSAFLTGVTQIAEVKLAEILGRAAPAPAAAAAPKTAKKTAAPAPASDKEKLAEEAGVGKAAQAAAAAPKAPADDVLEAPPADDLSDILGEPEVPRIISDKELGDLASKIIAKKKSELGDKWSPPKARELVAKFSNKKDGVPKITDVTADKRAAFLEALEALQ